MTPSGFSPGSKDSKMLNKATMLAMAHLISHSSAAPSEASEDQAASGMLNTDDDENTGTSIRLASPDNTMSGADRNGQSEVLKPKARLHTSLPSYRKLCRTAGVPISDQANEAETGTTTNVKDLNMPVLSSCVVRNPDGVIAGYMSAIQHSVSTSQDIKTRDSVPGVETSSNSHLQQLRQHRSTVFEEIIRNSITTTLSTKVRASIADEVRVRHAHLLSEHERAPNYAQSVLKARGKRYWLAMYELQEMSSHYGGRHNASQLVNDIYSRRDRAIAIQFWALHHERMRYAEICFELSLPLGALLQWLLEMSA